MLFSWPFDVCLDLFYGFDWPLTRSHLDDAAPHISLCEAQNAGEAMETEEASLVLVTSTKEIAAPTL